MITNGYTNFTYVIKVKILPLVKTICYPINKYNMLLLDLQDCIAEESKEYNCYWVNSENLVVNGLVISALNA